VRFACPYCGEILERVARLDETRWYLSGCGFGHSGIGIRDPEVQRVKAY
jgi:ribosomal protein L37AE/L43A